MLLQLAQTATCTLTGGAYKLVKAVKTVCGSNPRIAQKCVRLGSVKCFAPSTRTGVKFDLPACGVAMGTEQLSRLHELAEYKGGLQE